VFGFYISRSIGACSGVVARAAGRERGPSNFGHVDATASQPGGEPRVALDAAEAGARRLVFRTCSMARAGARDTA